MTQLADESSTKRLVLIRHGEIEQSVEGRLVGRTDVGLSEVGRAQATRLRPSLRRVRPAAFRSSPLTRARQTAELANAEGPAQTIGFDANLAEMDFGRWDGQTFESVERADPELVRRWVDEEHSFGFPGGESFEGFSLRVARAAEDLLALEAKVVVVFSHAGVIRMLLCHLLGMPASWHRSFAIQHATFTLVEQTWGRHFALRALNLPELAPSFFEGSSWPK